MPSNHAFVNENFLVLSVSFWKLHTITLFASKSPSYICLLLSNNIPEMSVSFSYASYICPLFLGSSSCKCPFLFLRHPRNVCFFHLLLPYLSASFWQDPKFVCFFYINTPRNVRSFPITHPKNVCFFLTYSYKCLLLSQKHPKNVRSFPSWTPRNVCFFFSSILQMSASFTKAS